MILRKSIAPAAVAAIAIAVAACGAESNGPVDGERALAHVRAIVELGPRPPGSEPLAKSADYIRAELAKLGLELQEQRFTHVNAPGIEFRNLWCEIPEAGGAGGGDWLMIACHYDTKITHGHDEAAHNFEFVGAIDGGGASGLLVELARHLVDRPSKQPIRLVWFDGEESLEFDWNDEKALFGSRHMAARLSERKDLPEVMVLLDLIGSKNIKIDRDRESFGPLNEIFLETARAMGEEERMFAWESPMTDDHIPFRSRGVKVIDLIDFRFRYAQDGPRPGEKAPEPGAYVAWWHTPQDTLDQMSAESLAFAGNLVINALPRIEARFFE